VPEASAGCLLDLYSLSGPVVDPGIVSLLGLEYPSLLYLSYLQYAVLDFLLSLVYITCLGFNYRIVGL